MTKNELIYKLLSSNCKIVDRGMHSAINLKLLMFLGHIEFSRAKILGHVSAGEVEEQLKLLLELVPDWISEKIAYSGDILCW